MLMLVMRGRDHAAAHIDAGVARLSLAAFGFDHLRQKWFSLSPKRLVRIIWMRALFHLRMRCFQWRVMMTRDTSTQNSLG